MRIRTHDGPLFHFVFADASEASAHSGALEAMFEKRLDGIILRGAIPEAALEHATRMLEQRRLPAHVIGYTRDQNEPAYTIGVTLVGTPSFEAYLDDAAAQRDRIAALFGPDFSFERRIAALVSAVASGLPAEVATGPDGRTFPFASVRVLPEGTEIGLHVGNEFAGLAQAEHLRSTLDLRDQLSWFCPITTPSAGGELVVYGLEWDDVKALVRPREDGAAHVWLEGTDVFEAVAAMESTPFAPGPGDLLIFDGGRYFHRVSKVAGPTPRRTIGGFLGFSRDHTRVHIWT